MNALREAGFIVISSPVEEASEEIEEGKVIRTEPAVGQLAALGSQVSIVVSTGLPTVEVPAVTDLFAETAIQILRDELLDAVVIFEQVPAGSPNVGRVMAQDPEPFEEVEVGLIVTITVGQVAQTTTTRPRPTTTTTTPPTTTTTPPTTTTTTTLPQGSGPTTGPTTTTTIPQESGPTTGPATMTTIPQESGRTTVL